MHEGARPPGGPEYGPLLAAARRLLDVVAGADAPDGAVRAATGLVAAACQQLEPHVVAEHLAPAGRRPDLPGRGHPILMPFAPQPSDIDEVRGTVTFTRSHLGGGAAAHGGVIPLLFDDVLGFLASRGGGRTPTRTAYLRVNYRQVTPLDVELFATAHVERIEGRKVFVAGELRLGDTVLADAEGLFIMIRPEQLKLSNLRGA